MGHNSNEKRERDKEKKNSFIHRNLDSCLVENHQIRWTLWKWSKENKKWNQIKSSREERKIKECIDDGDDDVFVVIKKIKMMCVCVCVHMLSMI